MRSAGALRLDAFEGTYRGPAAERFAWNGRAWVADRRWSGAMVLLMRIDRWDPRRDGPLSEIALRQKLEARGYSPTACTYQPGVPVPSRSDAVERLDAVVSGLLKVTIDGESAILTPGDAVLVPRGAVRRVEVVGNSPVRCFEAVYRGEPS